MHAVARVGHRRHGVTLHLGLDHVRDCRLGGRVPWVSPAPQPFPPPATFLPRRRDRPLASRHGLLPRRQSPRGEQRGHLKHQPERHVAEALQQELTDQRRFGGARVARAQAHGALTPELVAHIDGRVDVDVLVIVVVDNNHLVVVTAVDVGGRRAEHGLDGDTLPDGEGADGQLRHHRTELRGTPVQVLGHHARQRRELRVRRLRDTLPR